MANWRFNISLNKVLNQCNEDFDLSRHEEDCPEEVKEALAAEVAKAWPLARFSQKIRACKSIAELNRILEVVWDAADTERVWCGL